MTFNPPLNSCMASPLLPPRKRSLKARLHAGDKLYGGFLVTQAPYFAEMMGLVGYDYVVVDLEHGPGETEAALQCLRALEAVGTPAIIRVGFNDQVLLKKALDLGPSGVIVPMVQNKKKAEYAVSCCRYPPAGIRGAHPFVRATKFGLDKSYLSTYEKDLLLICQIESAEAVDLIPEIAGVDGVDGLMIGPRDLSASIGCFGDPTNPRLATLIDKAEQAVLASPRKVFLKGIARPEIDPPPALFSRGYHIVSGIMDVVLFTTAALADIRAHKPLPSPNALTANGDLHSLSSSNGVHPSTNGNILANGITNLSNGDATNANGKFLASLSNGDATNANGNFLASAIAKLSMGDAYVHSINGEHFNDDDNVVDSNSDHVTSSDHSINGNGHTFSTSIITS